MKLIKKTPPDINLWKRRHQDGNPESFFN